MKTLFLTLPQLASFFGTTRVARVRLWVQFSYFYCTRKFHMRRRAMRFDLQAHGVPFSIFLLSHHDVILLLQLFIEGEYDLCPIANPLVIVDLGAHFGDTALYYHTRFPQAHIIAVEPSPRSFARLVANTADIPNISCVQAALGTTNGTVQFHEGEHSQGSSVQDQESAVSLPSVRQRTLTSILSDAGHKKADIIKFDIEGAEMALLENNPAALGTFYIGEFHPDLTGTTVEAFAAGFAGAHVQVESVGSKGRSILSAYFSPRP